MPASLKIRLLVLAALGISLVLGLAGFGFNYLFQRQVEKFVLTDLTHHLDQLLAGVVVDNAGVITVTARMSDPRFELPEGGLYWQIDVNGQTSLRSRSLWDEALVVPTPPDTPEEDHAHIMTFPSGGEIFALEKLIKLENELGVEKSMVVTVGLDRERVTNPATEFSQSLMWGLGATYFSLLASTFGIILLGLRPLAAVKRGVAALRAGSTKLQQGDLPSEVAPLVDEVNALVQAREQQLARARERASNLAHGLKTPLAVMQAIANDLQSKGQHTEASSIGLNTSQMRDLVDRELTRSRMSDGNISHRTDFNAVCKKVIATMKAAPRGKDLTWTMVTLDALSVGVETVDLMELLGSVLDNARKHARSAVRISHDGKTLVIEDDGLGVSEDQIQHILKRGVRLDEKRPGSGIGLAIVADLSEVYGLDLLVRKSDLGGLAVVFAMPNR